MTKAKKDNGNYSDEQREAVKRYFGTQVTDEDLDNASDDDALVQALVDRTNETPDAVRTRLDAALGSVA